MPLRVRPFFKVFWAQSCAGRSIELKTRKSIFDFGPCLALPVGDLRKIYFTCYCNKKYILYIVIYNCNTQQKSPRGKGKRCTTSKNLISSYSDHRDVSAQGCASKTVLIDLGKLSTMISIFFEFGKRLPALSLANFFVDFRLLQ